MKIYTKTGDQGTTALFQGPRVPKNHPNIQAYGTVDELNSVLGLLRSCKLPEGIDQKIFHVQNTLFALGSDLATPFDKNAQNRFSANHVIKLEEEIDHWEQSLEPLKNFILPGGSQAASYAHLARTVCRRAERSTIDLLENGEIHIPCYHYLNRLSDWLFVLARTLNKIEKIQDVPWES